MTDSQYIMIGIGILLTIVFIELFIWYVFPLFSQRKRELSRMQTKEYPIAYAGNVNGDTAKEKSVSVTLNNFYDKNGNLLDPDNYKQFIVNGNSMKFCGIYDKDLVFVASDFRVVQLKKFPYILVLKRQDAPKQYKVRRAWGIATYNDNEFLKDLDKIISSKEFAAIKTLQDENGQRVYPGDEMIIDDFIKNRLTKYKKAYIDCENPDEWNKTVVLSTTFDTKDNVIHFSIHPIANIVGIVKESFTVNQS